MSDIVLLKEIDVRKTLVSEYENTGVLNRVASIETINSFYSFALSKYICFNNLDIFTLSASPAPILVRILKIQIEILESELFEEI